jgi:hypothetical protein
LNRRNHTALEGYIDGVQHGESFITQAFVVLMLEEQNASVPGGRFTENLAHLRLRKAEPEAARQFHFAIVLFDQATSWIHLRIPVYPLGGESNYIAPAQFVAFQPKGPSSVGIVPVKTEPLQRIAGIATRTDLAPKLLLHATQRSSFEIDGDPRQSQRCD